MHGDGNRPERHLSEDTHRSLLAETPLITLLDTISDGLIEVGPDFTCRYINRAAETMLRLDGKLLAAGNLLDALPMSMGSEIARHARQQSRPAEFEIFCAHLDTWFECRCFPMGGNLFLLFKDITVRRNAEKDRKSVVQNDSEEKLRRSEDRLRQLSRKTHDLLESERRAVANELHDSIGASLAAIKFSLESRIQQMPKDYRGNGHITFEKIVDYLQDAIRESKRISARLHPRILDELGLLATIDSLAGSYADLYPGIELVRAIDIQEEEIFQEYKIVLYRVLQEAINNAAKHSGADCVHLTLTRTGNHILMMIQDNGCGFDPDGLARSMNGLSGMGLHSMRERVEICNGTCRLISGIGTGTRIEVELPLA